MPATRTPLRAIDTNVEPSEAQRKPKNKAMNISVSGKPSGTATQVE